MRDFMLHFILLIFFIIMTSCSSNQKYDNIVNVSNMIIRGGNLGAITWEDELKFYHYSWISQGQLQFDIYLAKIDLKSPFAKWFSPSELILAEKCQTFIVSIQYVGFSSTITGSNFDKEMNKNNFSKVGLIDFNLHLMNHPNYRNRILKRYHLNAYCPKVPTNLTKQNDPLLISFPGYKDQILEY